MSKLVYAEFRYCFLGDLKMEGRPWADPASAFVAAHDIVDHTPKDRGTIENEMRALPCGYLTRKKIEGYFVNDELRDFLGRRKYAAGVTDMDLISRNIASDVAGIMMDHYRKQPKHKRAPDVSLIDLEDRIFVDKVFDKAADFMKNREAGRPIIRHLRWAKRWFKFGLALAYQRYGHIPDIAQKFLDLRDTLGRYVLSMDRDKKLGVVFDPATGDFIVDEIETPESIAAAKRFEELLKASKEIVRIDPNPKDKWFVKMDWGLPIMRPNPVTMFTV